MQTNVQHLALLPVSSWRHVCMARLAVASLSLCLAGAAQHGTSCALFSVFETKRSTFEAIHLEKSFYRSTHAALCCAPTGIQQHANKTMQPQHAKTPRRHSMQTQHAKTACKHRMQRQHANTARTQHDADPDSPKATKSTAVLA